MTDQVRRINIYGGPGSGKTTFAARLFSDLKVLDCDCEHIQEFVKVMAHEGRKPEGFDQVYILGEQMHREEIALRHVPLIVTDCPVPLCAAYAKYYNSPGWEGILATAQTYDKSFPALNLYIKRSVPYTSKGRYQTVEQAKEFDDFLEGFLKEYVVTYEVVDVQSFNLESVSKYLSLLFELKAGRTGN